MCEKGRSGVVCEHVAGKKKDSFWGKSTDQEVMLLLEKRLGSLRLLSAALRKTGGGVEALSVRRRRGGGGEVWKCLT